MKKSLIVFEIIFLFLIIDFVSAECIDSDGGKDYFTKGIVTFNGENFSDYCETFAGGNLIEYYCSSGVVDSESYGDCSEGCSEGACIVLGETCEDDCSTDGLTQCFGDDKFKSCGQHDSDSCLDWGSFVYCPSGQECSEGTCIFSSSTPSCQQVKKSCEISDDCCSGLICSNNLCCSPLGNSCFSNSECCSGYLCISNSCIQPVVCKTEGQSCVHSSECCSGLMCESYAGGSNTCVSTSGCRTEGQFCTHSSECCSGLMCESWAGGSETCISILFSNITSSRTADTENLSPTLEPEEIINYNTLLKISQINNITLEIQSEKLIYSISGIKEGKLFFFISVSAKVEQKLNANTGEIISTEKPWWSFLAGI